jgi:hypothetical protein
LVPWSAAAKAPNRSEGSIRHGAGWAPLGADAGPWHHVAQSSQTSEQGRDDLHYRHRQACDAMERLVTKVRVFPRCAALATPKSILCNGC